MICKQRHQNLEVLVTEHVGRYGIETKIDYDECWDNSGSSSVGVWKSTSRSLLWTTRSQCIVMKRSRDTRRLVALNPRRVQSQASSSASSMNVALPIDERRWKVIPAVRTVETSCYWISKRAAKILLHKDNFRETDWANRMGKAALQVYISKNHL